jgi:twitching motility protein PilU
MTLDQLLQQCLLFPGMDLWVPEGRVPFAKGLGRQELLSHLEPVGHGEILPLFRTQMDAKSRLNWENQGTCRFRIQGADGVIFRVDISRESLGALAVFRAVMSDLPNLDALKVPPAVKGLLDHQNGLILFSGPGASGTTTLASSFTQALCNMRSMRVRVLDPDPEWVIPSGKSLLVRGTPTGSLAEDIRASLISGTDLFLFGDIGPAQMDPILEACASGALVVASVRASSTTHALERIETGNPLLHRVLRGIIGSHLIPSIAGDEALRAWDVLLASNQVIAAIEKGEIQKIPQIQKAASHAGMVNLDDSLALLVNQKRISRDEARYRAHEPTAFE